MMIMNWNGTSNIYNVNIINYVYRYRHILQFIIIGGPNKVFEFWYRSALTDEFFVGRSIVANHGLNNHYHTVKETPIDLHYDYYDRVVDRLVDLSHLIIVKEHNDSKKSHYNRSLLLLCISPYPIIVIITISITIISNVKFCWRFYGRKKWG
jgi:hypothetical protein